MIKDGNKTYISKYFGELTDECLIENMAKIKSAFPGLPIEFHSILSDRIIEKDFCDEQLMDAVNHVIDNCIYPTPTIAQFVSFNKNRRLFTYDEMIKMVDESGVIIWKYYDKIKIDNIVYWFKKEK